MKNIPSNRDFGLTVGLILLLILTVLFITYSYVSIVLTVISFLLILLGAINSYLLLPFNLLWFNFGVLLGKVVSPIFILIFYFLIFTPYSVVGRMFSADLKKFLEKPTKGKQSYWEKSENSNNFENQF